MVEPATLNRLVQVRALVPQPQSGGTHFRSAYHFFLPNQPKYSRIRAGG